MKGLEFEVMTFCFKIIYVLGLLTNCFICHILLPGKTIQIQSVTMWLTKSGPNIELISLSFINRDDMFCGTKSVRLSI